jgi:hypothetical protein
MPPPEDLRIEFEDSPVRWEHMRKALPDQMVDEFLEQASEHGWELVAVLPCVVQVRSTIVTGEAGQPMGGVMLFFKRMAGNRIQDAPEASSN